jgi:hypothetical protein
MIEVFFLIGYYQVISSPSQRHDYFPEAFRNHSTSLY